MEKRNAKNKERDVRLRLVTEKGELCCSKVLYDSPLRLWRQCRKVARPGTPFCSYHQRKPEPEGPGGNPNGSEAFTLEAEAKRAIKAVRSDLRAKIKALENFSIGPELAAALKRAEGFASGLIVALQVLNGTFEKAITTAEIFGERSTLELVAAMDAEPMERKDENPS